VTGFSSRVFINEFHYDNQGSDTGEFIELAGIAGTDLTGWQVVLYNGSNGAPYDTIDLTGRALAGDIDNGDIEDGVGYATIVFPSNGLQNGSPDGIALVAPDARVAQFISYEGELTAVSGPAAGMTSTDIAVAESSATPVGFSVQLQGIGVVTEDSVAFDDLVFAEPQAETPDALNTGQSFEAPVANEELGDIVEFANFETGFDGGSEVVVHENGQLFVTNGALGRIDVFDLATKTLADSYDLTFLPGFDGVQSVAVKNGLVAVAVSTPDVTNSSILGDINEGQNGYVVLIDVASGQIIDRVTVGNLPDMVTFNADGTKIIVANEGEFSGESDLDRDPIGSISVIDVSNLIDPQVTTLDFSSIDGLEVQFAEAGIRLGPDASLLRGLEPEYISVEGDLAYVSLQEANSIAVFNIAENTLVDLFSLGTVDHSQVGNELDPNDDGEINIQTFDNLVGLRMPDAIDTFTVDGKTYIITANEGDGRGDITDGLEDVPNPARADEARVGDILDGEVPGVSVDESVDTTGLERLIISITDGDDDGDGDIDTLHAFGSRSFTIFDTDGNVVFDSGSEFEAIIAELAPERFNNDDGEPIASEDDNRSDAKGPEPEAVTVGEVNGVLYAFIGLERDSGIVIYNIADPANATFVDYISGYGGQSGDHVAPETIAFIPADESASGTAQIAVAYEVSGETVVYDLGGVIPEPITPQISEFQPNPDGSDPTLISVELTGTPGADFDLWLLSVESDAGNGAGTVDRAENVVGTFDDDGIAVVQVPDLENPSFTYILAEDFTGQVGTTDFDTDNDGVPDDLSALAGGEILDAIGVPDTAGEPLYGDAAGGTDLTFATGEPQLLFRDGLTGDIYRVEDGAIFDADGNEVSASEFDKDPTQTTFGTANPVRTPVEAAPDLQISEIWPGQEGEDLTEDWFEITNQGDAAWTPDLGALFYDDESADPEAADPIEGISEIGVGESVVVVIGTADDDAAFETVWGDVIDLTGVQVGYTDGAGLGGGGDAVNLFVDADGTLSSDDIVDTESYPDTTGFSGQSWDVNAAAFSVAGVGMAVATSATAGSAGDEPAVGSPGNGDPLGGDDITLISAIQGSSAGATQVTVNDGSPLTGQVVTISAVVTADFQEDLGGFFVQEEDADQDGDASTSEGIFIFDGSLDPAVDVSVGDLVTIEGEVGEFFGQTQITAGSITIEGSDVPLPTSTIIDLGSTGTLLDDDGEYVVNLEAVEGMLITIPEDLVISEMFNLDRFGQYTVSSEGRLYQFTQQNAPDVAGYDAHLQDVAARSLVLDDGRSDQNPEVIEIIDGDNGVLDANDSFRMGDTLSNVTGVVRYGFDEYRLDDATGDYTQSNPRPEQPEDVAGDFKVVSLNVLNFFTTLDDGSATTDTGAEPRGADDLTRFDSNSDLANTDPDAEFDRQAEKIVDAIIEIDADVFGLVELENSASDSAVSKLVELVNAELGADVYDYIPTGLAGNDAITNGFIYKVGTAQPVGEVAVLTEFEGQSFLDPLDAGRELNRPAVTQTFEDTGSGELVTISVNHFKSKGSLSGLAIDEDQGDGAGNNNGTREAASEMLAEWLATDPTGTGAENQLIIGDLNSYAEETPITALEAAGFTDVAQEVFGIDGYSYVFDGQVGTLDYILANGPAFDAFAGVTQWNINSDEADAIDYNLDFGRQSDLFNGDTPARNSDHDPIIAGFTFEDDDDGTVVAEILDLKDNQRVDEDDVNGIAPQNFLSGAQSSSFEVEMFALPGTFASFRNTVGVYEVDETGDIVDVEILFQNAKASAAAGETAMVNDVEAGHELGFFIVQDAFNFVSGFDDDAEFAFLNSEGAQANVSDGASIRLAVNGVASGKTVFHSYDAALNSDGIEHVLSAFDDAEDKMTIGFEDLTGGGDRDFEDVLFTVVDTFEFV